MLGEGGADSGAAAAAAGAAAAAAATAACPPAGAIAASSAPVADVPPHHFQLPADGADAASATRAGRLSGSLILIRSSNSVTY